MTLLISGTTACKWDTIIPFDKLWEQYNRIIKDNRAICIFGSEPFSSALRMSNIKNYKYDWIWKKNRKLGFTNAKNKPLNDHENISVFSNGTCANKSIRRMSYFPQGLIRIDKKAYNQRRTEADLVGHHFSRPSHKKEYIQQYTNYPSQIIEFASDTDICHPTQKPVALLEYLIKTYTNENETVLDNCMGSGSVGVAAVNTNRNFIGIELDAGYFEVAKNRIDEAQSALDRQQTI